LLAQNLGPAAQGIPAGAETAAMKLCLAPGDRLSIVFDTVAADAPLGQLTLSVDAPADDDPTA
jgi:hypothetical protein